MDFGDGRLPQRFWDKVFPEPNTGCWLWGGALTKGGYGKIRLSGKCIATHRAVLNLGPGTHQEPCVDHLCRVRSCCNPQHLQVVSWQENCKRGDHRSKLATIEHIAAGRRSRTHCEKGHEYSMMPNGKRRCGVCYKKYQQDYRVAKRTK